LDRCSQVLSFVAVQVSEPVPEFEIFERVDEDRRAAGVGAVGDARRRHDEYWLLNHEVTGIFAGEPVTAPASTSTGRCRSPQ